MAWVSAANLRDFAKGFEEKARGLFAKKTDIPTTLPANGGDAATVGGHTVGINVPSNAKFTDTTYSVMKGATVSAAGTKGLVPAPAKGQQEYLLCGDGTWGKIEELTNADIDAIIAGTFTE